MSLRLFLNARPVLRAAMARPLAVRAFSTGEEVQVAVPHVESTLEWVLPSPPPLHCFDEPPMTVLCNDDSACEWVNPQAH